MRWSSRYERTPAYFGEGMREGPQGSWFLPETAGRQPQILRRDEPFGQVVVPDHKELDRGTLRAIIRQSGLSVDEFIKLL